MNTRIWYLYRDASNYKLWFQAVVAGRVPERLVDDIRNLPEYLGKKIDTGVFYPEKVMLPADTFVSHGFVPYDDDPDFHELISMEYTDDDPTVGITAEKMLSLMRTRDVFGSRCLS